VPTRFVAILLAAAALCLLSAPAALADFGLHSADVTFSNEDGTPATQAGSHPFAMTATLSLNTTVNALSESVPDGDLRNLAVNLPAGVIGSAVAVPRCSQEQFTTAREDRDYNKASCPADTAVGVATLDLPSPHYVSIYNLVPTPGTAAEFGFNVSGVPMVLTSSVRTGGDYGLTVASRYTNQTFRISGVSVTLWGVPGATSHNGVRGVCLDEYTGGPRGEECPTDVAPRPFLALPTTCGAPLLTTIAADSWQGGEAVTSTVEAHDTAGNPLGITGCAELAFEPTIETHLDTDATSTPAGMAVSLRVPQNEDPAGLVESNVRQMRLSLPAGLAINPAALDGIGVCTTEEVALESPSRPTCPDDSKIGSATLHTPLLETPLSGFMYLAAQNANPFDSLLAVYVVTEASGLMIKLAGHIEADPNTGQLTTSFDDTPQQPFSELELHFFGGPRSMLVTPAACGNYTTAGTLTPWSGETPVSVTGGFAINSSCAASFAPTFLAGTTANQAAGFGTLTTTISRGDQDQPLNAISMQLPPGLLGRIAAIPPCEEPQAAASACSPASQIGHLAVTTGAGPDPLAIPQSGSREDPVYLTGPYKGAPFGLLMLIHTEAGPFNLGDIPVRATVTVDPQTAQLTVTSDPLPTIRQGIPLRIRTVSITIDHAGFIFNPTSCNPLSERGTVTSTEGASANLASRFQAAGCSALPFKPKLTAYSHARTSRANGMSLEVKVNYPAGSEANMRSITLHLPKQLSSRLTTIQNACLATTFQANPASCPAASDVGTARALTPVLKRAMSGPVYLISHGGKAFPDIVVVLQGEGVTVNLAGAIGISASGATSSTFGNLPDAPVSSFAFTLPTGPHSLLAPYLPASAKGQLCGTKLLMPTTITGQNGAVITQSTKIAITGCPKVQKAKAPKRK
jgi:hypothetical protein